MFNILIVEDDISLGEGLKLALKKEDIHIVVSKTIRSADYELAQTRFDLIILDINLPDGNGFDLLKKIRETSEIPTIILTANDVETEIVKGFEYGADDYVCKPFSLAVLRARVDSQLRKIKSTSKDIYKLDDLYFDFEKMEFKKKSSKIIFSKNEIKLLKIFIDNKGIVLHRENLVDKIWTDSGNYVYENSLSVVVKRIRDKIEDVPAKPRYLKTVYGIGYKWVEE